MKNDIINFLRHAFPFLMVVALWRLAGWFWNPGGILALIIIFFCTFVRHLPFFGVFGLIFCFLIDYKSNTLCMWTMLFCLFYAINGFQGIIDLGRMDKNARDAFMVFIGTGIIILMLMNFTFANLWRSAWIMLWTGALYLPTTELIKKVQDD